MTDQIDFFCVHPDHQAPPLLETLTIHDDKWAYCPSGGTDGHEWRHYAEMTLDDLSRLLQARGKAPANWMRDLEQQV